MLSSLNPLLIGGAAPRFALLRIGLLSFRKGVSRYRCLIWDRVPGFHWFSNTLQFSLTLGWFAKSRHVTGPLISAASKHPWERDAQGAKVYRFETKLPALS